MKKDPPYRGRMAAHAACGVEILVGGDEPDQLITAKLLATIARPPSSPSDPAWRELVGAFYRVILSLHGRLDPEAAQRPQMVVLALLEVSQERAEKLVGEALDCINKAFGAAHAQMPSLVRGVWLEAGLDVAKLPRPWRQATTLAAESDRVMRYEAEFAEFLEERGEEAPARFPGIESAEAPANFRNRVVKPFRGVVHLVGGLAQVIDAVERQLARDASPGDGGASLGGFAAYPGQPRLLIEQVLLIPEISVEAINCAQRLEAGLPHLEAQRPKPEEVVRLRWREVRRPAADVA